MKEKKSDSVKDVLKDTAKDAVKDKVKDKVFPSLDSSDMARLDNIIVSLTTEDPGSKIQEALSAFLGNELPLDGFVGW